MSRDIPAIREQLAALGIRPKKRLGQNFLVDPVHLERIVAAADLAPTDLVLEVGPGLGWLTDLLAEKARHVVAVELDDRLIRYLRARFALRPHVEIVYGDILKLQPGALLHAARVDAGAPGGTINHGGPESTSSYKVVANLPYYITSAVIRHFLEASAPPALLVLTVQQEVAARMVASPPRMNLLALGVQFYCEAGIVGRIPAGAFYPVPKVDSAFVRLVRRSEPAVAAVTADVFFKVVRAGFSQPRKQLRNSLAGGLGRSPLEVAAWLERAGIDPRRRAESLSLAEWGTLARTLGHPEG